MSFIEGNPVLVDLRVKGKTVLVIGGGKIGEHKVKKIVSHFSKIVVISKFFTPYLKALKERGKVVLIDGDLREDFELFSDNITRSDLVFACTDDAQLNQTVSEHARKSHVLVNAVDMPHVSDFYSPATFQKGSIRVGICTDGKSPLMSKILRERLEKVINAEDSHHVELQSYSRQLLKEKVANVSQRRGVLYKIYENVKIRSLLRQGRLEDAKEIAENVIEEALASFRNQITSDQYELPNT
jgi:precorrin-2 dehydrogenase/sirohydrochlorin ferrochelatase